jgi:hypothetical protein
VGKTVWVGSAVQAVRMKTIHSPIKGLRKDMGGIVPKEI